MVTIDVSWKATLTKRKEKRSDMDRIEKTTTYVDTSSISNLEMVGLAAMCLEELEDFRDKDVPAQKEYYYLKCDFLGYHMVRDDNEPMRQVPKKDPSHTARLHFFFMEDGEDKEEDYMFSVSASGEGLSCLLQKVSRPEDGRKEYGTLARWSLPTDVLDEILSTAPKTY